MSKNTQKNSAQSNKFKLISQFIEQSSYISKSPKNDSSIMSQLTHSRQIIYVNAYDDLENQFKVKIQPQKKGNNCQKRDQTSKQNSTKSTHYDLKQSFVNSELDTTTYQNLMQEFMGSYLQEKLANKMKQNFVNTINSNEKYEFSHEKSRNQPIVEINQRDSQITFSGSKDSRIINPNQQSRIVKEQYFLLDQLRSSKQKKKKQSRDKKTSSRKSSNFKRTQQVFQQSYQLRQSRSRQRSIERVQRQRSISKEKTPIKIKTKQINLTVEASHKKPENINNNQNTKQKYTISKRKEVQPLKFKLTEKNDSKIRTPQKTFEKSRSKQPKIIHVNLDEKNNQNEKEEPLNIKKSIKKSPQKAYNLQLKTFHISSSSKNKQKNAHKRQEKGQSEKQFLLQDKKSMQKSKEMTKIDNKLDHKRPVQQKNSLKQQLHQQKTFQNSKKYDYQFSYNTNKMQQFLNHQDKIPDIDKSFLSNTKSNYPQQSNKKTSLQQQQIQRDRSAIRDIKKDILKLMKKIGQLQLKDDS